MEDPEVQIKVEPEGSPRREVEQEVHDVKFNTDGGEEAERGQVNNTESLESDGSQIGYGVIWGEQITNTLNKLRSLTFFSVGAEPIPAPPPVPREPRSKRKPRGSQPSRRAQGGRKPKNPKPKLFSSNYERGSESSATLGSNSGLGMGQNELQEEGNFPKEVFCLDDVANYECVTSSEATPAAPNQVDPETGDPGQRRKSSALGSKPNNTYTEIIAKALEEYPNGLTVSEIYEYISSRYSYYQPNDDRWKNSVRHNLSISPYFRKGEKAKQGAGHIWTINPNCQDIRTNRRRYGSGLIPKRGEREVPGEAEVVDLTKFTTESELAVANILGNYTRECNGEPVLHRNPPNVPSEETDEKLEERVTEELVQEDNSGQFMTVNVLDFEELQLHYGGIMEELHGIESDEPNQILSLDSDYDHHEMRLGEGRGQMIDGAVFGPDNQVLDISYTTYFPVPEPEALFMEGDPELLPMEQNPTSQ